jgi:hypothetical protein
LGLSSISHLSTFPLHHITYLGHHHYAEPQSARLSVMQTGKATKGAYRRRRNVDQMAGNPSNCRIRCRSGPPAPVPRLIIIWQTPGNLCKLSELTGCFRNLPRRFQAYLKLLLICTFIHSVSIALGIHVVRIPNDSYLRLLI